MTETAKKLIAELEKLPEEQQEERAKSYLEDLRHRTTAQETQAEAHGKAELYEPFKVLQEADLDLPPDYSETYEEHLYGIKKENNE